HSPGQGQGRLEGLGQTLFDAFFADQTVDHHLDRVLVVAVETDVFGQVPHLAVDAGPGEALGSQVLQQVGVFALAAPHHRCQHLEACSLLQLEDLVDDLLGGLSFDLHPVVGAVGNADASVQQPQVVPD